MIISKINFFCLYVAVGLFALLPFSYAKGIYQTNEDFISEVYSKESPKESSLLLTGQTRKDVEGILGHPYSSVRVIYWNKEGRSAWILEEIGKTEPITFGIVVKDNKIETIKVLAFRESRGWEVRYPAFTAQFKNAALNQESKLDKNIDGISGATLSFWAMTAIARLSLYLDERIKNK